MTKRLAFIGLLFFLVDLPAKAALINVERGLTTQSEGIQTSANPGDLGTITAGDAFKRVRIGSKVDAYQFTLTTTQGFLDGTYTVNKIDDHSWSVTAGGGITAIVTRNDTWRINVNHSGIEIAIFDAPLVDLTQPPTTGWVFNSAESVSVTGGVVTNFAATWPIGWSAENTRGASANMVHNWTIGASSITTSTGCLEAAYYFSHPVSFDVPGRYFYLLTLVSVGGAEWAYLKVNVPTLRVDLESLNARFTSQVGISTITPNTWVRFRLAYAKNGALGMDLKVKMKTCPSGQSACSAWTTIATVNNYNQNGSRIESVNGGAGRFGDARAAIRYSLPSLYSMTAMTDADTELDILDPPNGPNNWYVSSCASGGGAGTTLATAWTGAELSSRTVGEFQILGSTVIDPTTGFAVGIATNDADVLARKYKEGQAIPYGDRVYFDDSCGFVSLASTDPVTLTYSDNARFQSVPGLGHKADVRGTTRLASTDWGPIGGGVYVATVTNQLGVLFEYDSVSDANLSTDNNARVLTHPTAANLAAYQAIATAGSFWSDGGSGNGTHVYVFPTGSGDPRSSGKVYELTRQNNMFVFNQNGALVEGLNLRFSMGVGVNNNAGSDGTNADIIKTGGDGMFVYDNNNLGYGGRHILAVTENGQTKFRYIVLNSLMNYAYPTSYGAVGGQTLSVLNMNNDATDNQAYWENVVTGANVIEAGSKTGTIDPNNSVYFEHNNVTPFTNRGLSKTWYYRIVAPGASSIGAISNNVVIDQNQIGDASSSGSSQLLGGKNMTLTRSKIYSRGIPGMGWTGGTVLVRSNIIILMGQLTTGTITTSTGTITLIGNTIDASNTTTSSSALGLLTRGGACTWGLVANNWRFNNSASYMMIDTFTIASGDSLTMLYNRFEGTNASRVLVSSAGVTKTLAQLQTSGQDVGTTWTADLLLSTITWRFPSTSVVRSTVPVASLGAYGSSFSGTSDYYGQIRPTSGNADSGAVLSSSGGAALQRRRRRN